MPISFVCPECKKKLKAPDQASGKSLPCPQCQTRLTVPSTKIQEEFDASWLEDTTSPVPSTKNQSANAGIPQYEVVDEPTPAPTQKKTRNKEPARKEVLRADETPFWMRHLHWALLLALVPLIISLGFTTNREESMANLIDSLKDLDETGRNQLIEALSGGMTMHFSLHFRTGN